MKMFVEFHGLFEVEASSKEEAIKKLFEKIKPSYAFPYNYFLLSSESNQENKENDYLELCIDGIDTEE